MLCHKIDVYAECHYAECRYAECRGAHCQGKVKLVDKNAMPNRTLKSQAVTHLNKYARSAITQANQLPCQLVEITDSILGPTSQKLFSHFLNSKLKRLSKTDTSHLFQYFDLRTETVALRSTFLLHSETGS